MNALIQSFPTGVDLSNIIVQNCLGRSTTYFNNGVEENNFARIAYMSGPTVGGIKTIKDFGNEFLFSGSYSIDEFLKTSGDDEVGEQFTRVSNLIEGFETPYGMELLATVHWVVTRESDVRTADDALIAVRNWNARKRAILREEHIRVAWHRLNDGGWFRPFRKNRKDGFLLG